MFVVASSRKVAILGLLALAITKMGPLRQVDSSTALLPLGLSKQSAIIPERINLMAVERKVMRYDEDKYIAEELSVVDERKRLRQSFEQLEEFDSLFLANDDAYQQSEQGPADRLRWVMYEQALIECMGDGTIWREVSERLVDRRTKPAVVELTPEEEARLERRRARARRSRNGKRRH